jgi:hypothetical protein
MNNTSNDKPKELTVEEQIAAARAAALADAEAEFAEVKAQLAANLAEAEAKAKEEVAEARSKAIELAKRNNELEESINKGTAAKTIKGKFKGYSFEPGHARVRNRSGELCDTQLLMDAANDKDSPAHADAVETLTWLIDIKYAYFSK